ncbi:MAG: penicillin-binding protein [Saprospiraceae bacterium]|nr:penicillin-binding protein [Saprospiraceae bacterium]
MWKKIEPKLISARDFLLKWGKQFINWRIARYKRFKTLNWYRKTANVILTSIVLFFIYLVLVDINVLWLFGKSPGLRAIANPKQHFASEVYSADGKLLGRYFTEDRTPVSFSQISPSMINTLIATEDERFYNHFGIDFQGLFAAARDMTKGNARGASTITQQLVKNMFKTRNQYSTGLFGYIPGIRLIIMKSKEWITAVKLEIFYSKREILTMYLNTVDFGSNSYGIYTASKTFFNTIPRRLNYLQSATLVGVLKATTTYNPINNPDKCRDRRNLVLNVLADKKHISQEEAEKLKAMPLMLDINMKQQNVGNALHFRMYLKKYLDEWEKETGYDIFADGLKIYTTLDTRVQKYAEEAVLKHMQRVQRRFFEHWRWGRDNPWRDENNVEIPNFIEDIAKKTKDYKLLKSKFGNNIDSIDYYLNKKKKVKVFDYKLGAVDTTMSVMDSIRYMNNFLHCGFVAMEPQNGFVKAWVGDVDFNFWQYDKVGQSKRQPGSTFKLFVYGAALDNGLGPCDTRTDKPVTWDYMENGMPKSWSPRNSTGNWLYQDITLKHAFARSINSVAVQLAQEVGIKEVAKYAHLMGIQTPLEENASLCLGSSDVSLLELTNSFCTPLNEGKYHEPVLVTKIEDRTGKVIFEYDKNQKQVLSYETAWLLTELLKAGMTEPGAITQALWEWDLFRWDTEFGGKTGTSSNHSDAWFVGVSPKLVGGSWVGGDHRSIHFRTSQLGEASRTALPIYGLFMEKVLADEALKEYRGKWTKKPTQTILKDYSCHTVYVRVDTTAVDTSAVIEPDTIIEEIPPVEEFEKEQ